VSGLGEELIASILENESVETISGLLGSGSPVWYQNELEGISPLHAAAFVQNVELVKMLIEKGAVWNAVDYLKNTAGDIALSFNNAEIYSLIRDAGIRSGASPICNVPGLPQFAEILQNFSLVYSERVH